MLMLGDHSSEDNNRGNSTSPARSNLLDRDTSEINGNIKQRDDSENEYLDEENINIWFF